MGINKNKYKYHYKCVGCNEDTYSDKYYPYGCVCKKCRNKVRIKIPCSDCGKEFEIPWQTYFAKYPDGPYRCSDCFIKHQSEMATVQWEKMTPEEYNWHCNIRSINSIKMWKEMTPKKLEKITNKLKETLSNRTQEELENIRNKISEANSKNYHNKSQEEKEKQLQLLQKGNESWRENLLTSPEEYDKYIETLSLVQLQRWAKATEEERREHSQNISIGLINHWANATQEEHKRASKISRKKYYNRSLEDIQKSILKGQETWSKKNYDDFLKIEYVKAINCNNKSNEEKIKYLDEDDPEYNFMKLLDKYNFNYKFQYYNTDEHPRFRNLFSTNLYNKYGFVSPLHRWDFMLELYNRNIFIDVDGSHHDPEQLKYYANNPKTKRMDNMEQKQYFYDFNRLYQTDNLDSYILLVYDDIIDENKNIIMNIKTGQRYNLRLFLCELQAEEDAVKSYGKDYFDKIYKDLK